MTVHRQPTSSELRLFALLQAPVLIYLGWGLLHRGVPQWVAFGLMAPAMLAAPLGFVRPQAIRGYYRIWMAVVTPLGQCMIQLLMAVIYFAVVTPVAAVRRLIHGDSLNRVPDAGVSTYWIERSGPSPGESYFRQF